MKQAKKQLSELSGSGEYVTVDAWVNKEIDLDTHDPQQKVRIGDGTTDEPRFVVVPRKTRMERLDEGTRYRFEGVKDHWYEGSGQVQLLVSKYSTVQPLSHRE